MLHMDITITNIFADPDESISTKRIFIIIEIIVLTPNVSRVLCNS